MRASIVLLALPLLAGCTGSSGRVGPGNIPHDAYGAMYTDLPASPVAACIADAIGGTLQPRGDRIVVTSPIPRGATYDVGANAVGGDYPTEVIVRGGQHALEEQRAAACFTQLPAA